VFCAERLWNEKSRVPSIVNHKTFKAANLLNIPHPLSRKSVKRKLKRYQVWWYISSEENRGKISKDDWMNEKRNSEEQMKKKPPMNVFSSDA
jgi:hypothetical protein